MIVRCAALVLALGTAAASAADMDCAFVRECLTGEACAETTYSLRIDQAEGMLRDEAGAMPILQASILPAGDALMAANSDTGEVRLLTNDRAGGAILTVHLPDLAITYFGTCSEVE